MARNDSPPVLLGEWVPSPRQANWKLINKAINEYSLEDRHTVVISTADLKHKGDSIHFNSKGQRMMGRRFAEAYLKKFK